MTALERQWVESEWRELTAGWHARRVSKSVFLEAVRDYRGGCMAGVFFVPGGRPVLPSPLSGFESPWDVTLAEAKADAEAMYRQWVYDTHGVVLP